MRAVLGIDAAWTPEQPSGVALVEEQAGSWRVVAVAPSYASFVAYAEGEPIDWGARRFPGAWPDVARLLEAARRSTAAEIAVVAVDMPLGRVPFETRRAADTAISKAFGSRGCATHSPTPDRPGALGRSLMDQLVEAGIPLATRAAATPRGPCTIEVYPHPALLSLVQRERRVPYKASRSLQYWPGTSVAERIRRIHGELAAILDPLDRIFGGVPVPLQTCDEVGTLAATKRFEDAIDALVCAWVGVCFLEGTATPYGDESAAIWVPEPGAAANRRVGGPGLSRA